MSATSKAFKAEPEELAAHLVAAAGDRSPPGFPVFVRYRFWRPFQYSVKSAGWYGWAFSGLSVLVIAAGLGSSAIAAGPGKTNNTAIAILGLVVALGTAVNRLWRPGLRAVVRSQTANSLRREGWAFVCTRDKYAEAEPSERIPLFVDEVERINVAVESIDEQPVDDQPGQDG